MHPDFCLGLGLRALRVLHARGAPSLEESPGRGLRGPPRAQGHGHMAPWTHLDEGTPAAARAEDDP